MFNANGLESLSHFQLKWEDRRGDQHIAYTGTAFVVVGSEVRGCHNGPARKKRKQEQVDISEKECPSMAEVHEYVVKLMAIEMADSSDHTLAGEIEHQIIAALHMVTSVKDNIIYRGRIEKRGVHVCSAVVIASKWILTLTKCIEKGPLSEYSIFVNNKKDEDEEHKFAYVKSTRVQSMVLVKVLQEFSYKRHVTGLASKKIETKTKKCVYVGVKRGEEYVDGVIKKGRKLSKTRLGFHTKSGSICAIDSGAPVACQYKRKWVLTALFDVDGLCVEKDIPGERVSYSAESILTAINEDDDEGFYNIVHMTNTPAAVKWAVEQGANAVELDWTFDSSTGLPSKIYHGVPCDCTCHFNYQPENVCSILDEDSWLACNADSDIAVLLSTLAKQSKIALTIIDSKIYSDDMDAHKMSKAGEGVVELLHKHLFYKGYGGQVIIGSSGFDTVPYLKSAIAGMQNSPYRSRTYFSIDQGTDIFATLRELSILPTRNIIFSYGSSACFPYSIDRSTMEVAVEKKANGEIGMTYIWSVDRKFTMEENLPYVQGILSNHPSRVNEVLQEHGISLATQSSRIPPATYDSMRAFVRILTISNGGQWGDWHEPDFCSEGTYASGYSMQIAGWGGDDTSLNSIKLYCKRPSGDTEGKVTSETGLWGSWGRPVYCNDNGGKPDFLTAFNLQVERARGVFWDDTAANYVKFKCRDLAHSSDAYELVKPPGHGLWGEYGEWSAKCPQNSAICGLRTKIEKRQKLFIDNTALNEVDFYCCE